MRNSQFRYRVLAVTLFVAVTFVPFYSAVAQGPAAAAPAAQSAASPEVHAVLDKIVMTKKAKVGDKVSARVTDNAKLKEVEIPKGSHLTGTVTEVKEKADKEGPAKLAILFDKAQIKGGSEVPVSIALVSVAPPWQPGGVDSVAADNKLSGAGRINATSAATGRSTEGSGGDTLSKGLGIRTAGVNADPAAMQPGVSYVEGLNIAGYNMAAPGTVIESQKGTFYLDSGTRLLFLGQ